MPKTTDLLAFEGRSVLVTGASSGIGRATAVLASQFGARVALVARREDELYRVIGELSGVGHCVIPADLTDFGSIPAVLDQAVAQIGPLAALVHAAGLHAITPLRALTAAQIDRIFDVNVKSAFLIAKAFRRPSVRAHDASLVLMSSAVGIVGSAGVSAYAASKAAVASIAQSLALELGRERIRVNSIAAGIVETPLTSGLEATIGADAWNRITAAHPLGIGSAEDVAAAAIFLASPAARWITGTAMVVDGGYTAQ